MPSSKEAPDLTLVGEFAAGLSHELRNPLSAVRNAYHYIRRRMEARGFLDDEPKVREFLKIIDNELLVANGIVQNLLDFARERPLVLSVFGVRELIDDAVASLSAPDGVQLEVNVEPMVPPVCVDRAHIVRSLALILENAFEAVPKSDARVAIDAHREEAYVVLSIADNGPGMTPEHAERIFEPLYTTKARGSGLGLSVAHRVVTQHSGEIRVESESGRGTRIVLRLRIEGPGD